MSFATNVAFNVGIFSQFSLLCASTSRFSRNQTKISEITVNQNKRFHRFKPHVKSPQGSMVVQGKGIKWKDLPFYQPPAVSLNTDEPHEILQILGYAGIHYRSPDSEAARYAVDVFKTSREFAFKTRFDRISFDWDHTLSNFIIFENVWGVGKTRLKKKEPGEELGRKPMVVLEVARPFMQDMAMGMMVGYAMRQGLKSFDRWENYEPQVILSTHTWPDRIGVLAAYFVRFIPLMEGLLPGTSGMYGRVTDRQSRAFVDLHHYLLYADHLMDKFKEVGFRGLNPQERIEAWAYFEDGKAHYRKPLGALAMKGWKVSTFLHFEDSTRIVSDLEDHPLGNRVRGVYVRQCHSNSRDASEFHKILPSALWLRSRDRAKQRVAEKLAWAEWGGSTIAALLGALEVFESNELSGPELTHWLMQRTAGLPEGIIFMLHETHTTLGEFRRYYVNPTNRRKREIRKIRDEYGGLKAIRRAFEKAQTTQKT